MNGSPDYFPRNASLKLRNWKAGKSEKQQNLTKISLHLLSFQGTQSFSGDGLPETHRPDALHHDLELRGHRQGHRNGPLRPVPHGTAAAATDLLKEAPPGEGRLVLQATQQGRQLLVSQHCQGRRELTKFSKVRLCLVTLYFYEFFGTFPSLILEEDLCIEVATELHGSQCLVCGSLLKAHRTIQHTESCQRHNFRSPSTIQGRNDTSGTQKPQQAWGQRSQSNGGIGRCQRRSEWQPHDGIQHMNGFMCFYQVDAAEHACKLMFISLER